VDRGGPIASSRPRAAKCVGLRPPFLLAAMKSPRASRRTSSPKTRDRSESHAKECARPLPRAGGRSRAHRRAHSALRAACSMRARGSGPRAPGPPARKRDSRLARAVHRAPSSLGQVTADRRPRRSDGRDCPGASNGRAGSLLARSRMQSSAPTLGPVARCATKELHPEPSESHGREVGARPLRASGVGCADSVRGDARPGACADSSADRALAVLSFVP